MIITKIINTGFAVSDISKENKEYMLAVMALLRRRVITTYERSHRITKLFGAVSHLKQINSEKVRDAILMQDQYYFSYKYKIKTTQLLLKLDKIVEYIEYKIISIKANLRSLRNKICKILHLNNKKY